MGVQFKDRALKHERAALEPAPSSAAAVALTRTPAPSGHHAEAFIAKRGIDQEQPAIGPFRAEDWRPDERRITRMRSARRRSSWR